MGVVKQKSATVSKAQSRSTEDQRVRRTRAQIDAAFVELLHRRAYGNIRVSDITKKARIGRATFYAHYVGKDELLRSQFERIVSPMLASAPETPARVDALYLFAHIGSSPEIYKAFMGSDGGSAPRILRQCFEKRIREILGVELSS